VLGLIDDLYKLSARVRLILQFALSISLLTQLRGTAYYPEFFGNAFIDSTLALVWLVFWANLLNMFDNHDGAAAGVIGIVFLGLSILAWLDGSTAIMTISITILGSTLGFLHWNWPPARIYLGDSGALLLSYTAGIFFLLIDFSNMSPLSSLFVPMICSGVLLLDFLLVFFSRLRRGVSPTIGDKTHSAHRLLKKGLSKSRINLILYSFTVIGNLFGIFVTLPQFSTLEELLIVLLFGIIGALYLSRIGKLSY
jgi:UDP-GlcNAc:undecaprenyl-phosphate GlcNAc-1-phosphate transferase